MTSATMAAQADLDERILAQSALDAAEDNLQSLCASQASTFVQVERRGKALHEGLAALLGQLETVQGQVTEAQELLQQDEGGGGGGDGDGGEDQRQRRPTLAALAEQHRVRRRTLLQHSSLLELLELPSLMDACVRSNLYDEALSIAGLANTLERRSMDSSASGTNNTATTTTTAEGEITGTPSSAQPAAGGWVVVRQVVDQIRQRQEDLRQQLWLRLSQASVTLPDCLEVVTALRRLNAIDLERTAGSRSSQQVETVHAGMEVQLQIDFLEARDVWLETTSSSSSSRSAPSSSSGTAGGPVMTEDLLDTIERYRTRVFEIATQFNAIFRANAPNAPTATGGDNNNNSTLSSVALLRLWMSRRVETFLHVLATQLRDHVTETSHLRDALEAALFFATSLGRLGADFTARLPGLFEPVLVQIITASWKDGAKQLTETLVTCREAGVATPLATGDASTSAMEANAAPESGGGQEEGQPLRPPRMLLDYPPLARFVNAILLGLNELRRCLLPGVVGRLQTALKDVLTDVYGNLNAHERAVHVPGLQKGPQTTRLRQLAVSYRELVQTVVEPYVWGSLYAAVGNVTAAKSQYEILQTNLQPPAPEEPEEEEEEEEKEEKDGDNDDDDDIKEDEETGTDAANVQDGQEAVNPESMEDQAEAIPESDADEKEAEDQAEAIPEGDADEKEAED